MLTDTQTVATLRQHHLFDQLPAEAFQQVCHRALLRRPGNGETLFRQRDAAARFYLLVRGQVKLTRLLPEGQEKLVEVIEAGQTFAEAVMFTGSRHYPVTATTLRASVLVSVDSPHYRQLLEQQPGLCLQLLARLSTRLHQRLNEMDTLTLGNASQRVARFLCQQQEVCGAAIELKVPKRLIASQLGIQPETLSRILHRLTDAGLISVERRLIQVLDTRSLAHYQA